MVDSLFEFFTKHILFKVIRNISTLFFRTLHPRKEMNADQNSIKCELFKMFIEIFEAGKNKRNKLMGMINGINIYTGDIIRRIVLRYVILFFKTVFQSEEEIRSVEFLLPMQVEIGLSTLC